MANTKFRKSMSSQSKGVIVLVILLAITVFVSCLAVGGMKLDKDGVNILLPWVPVSSENWPASLPLSRALGGGSFVEYAVEGDDTQNAVNVLKARLQERGVADSAVALQDNVIRVELPEMSDTVKKNVLSLVEANGKFEFRTQDGETFMTEKDVQEATAGFADATGSSFVLALKTNEEGTQKLADATAAHINETISIFLDGRELVAATVGQAFTTGEISVPLGLDMMDTLAVAIQMNNGAFDAKLTRANEGALQAEGESSAALKVCLIICAVLLLAAIVVIILKGKLTGVAAAWAIWCAVMILLFLFATVVLASMTVGCMIAVMISLVLFGYTAYLRVDAIAKAIASGSAVKQAVKFGSRASAKMVWLTHAAVLVVSIILMIIPATKAVGYTLAAGVFASAVAVGLTRVFLGCFTMISKKPALFGNAK